MFVCLGFTSGGNSWPSTQTDLPGTVLQGTRRWLDPQLPLQAQLHITQATDATSTHLHLAVHEGVEVELVAGHENGGVTTIP